MRRRAGVTAMVASALLLSACGHMTRGPATPPPDIAAIPNAVPKKEPPSASGNPDTYVVMGKRYRVRKSARGFVQRGQASWYGRKFQGRLTSSGQPYDMYKMTAAHKTLPIPCYVRVTNLDNGRQVVVRVNDRGPFHANRIIDLSYVAAAKLGMISKGTAPVKIRVLTPWASPASNPNHPTWYLQAGAFASHDNARRLAARVKSQGLDKVFIAPTDTSTMLYRVRIGPFASNADADNAQRLLTAAGIPSDMLEN